MAHFEFSLGSFSLALGRARKPESLAIPADSPMGNVLAGLRSSGAWGYSAERNKEQQLKDYTGYVMACVNARAQREARAKYLLRRKGSDEILTEKQAPIPVAFFQRPNPVMSGYFLGMLTSIHVRLTGCAYLLKIRNNLGVPVMQWPLLPSRVRAMYDAEDWVRFEYTDEAGQVIKIPAKDMIWYRTPHPTKLFDGIGMLEAAGLFADTDRLLWEMQRVMFSDPPVATWMITYDKDSPLRQDEANLLAKMLGQRVADPTRRKEPLVLGKGAKAERADFGNDGLEVPALNEEIKERIRSAFMISKTILGEVPGESRANVEGADYGFSQTVKDYHRLIDEERERSVLPEWDENLTGDFEDVVPEDREFLLRERIAMVRSRAMTPNEWRAIVGLPPVEGGDEMITALAPRLEGIKDEPPEPKLAASAPVLVLSKPDRAAEAIERFNKHVPPAEREVAAIVRGIFERESREIVNRVETLVPAFLPKLAEMGTAKRVKQYFLTDKHAITRKIADTSIFKDWWSGIDDPIFALFSSTATAAAASYGVVFFVNKDGISKLASHLYRSKDLILQATADLIREALEEGFLAGEGIGDLARRIRDIYQAMGQARAELIARTETTGAANFGSLLAYKKLGLHKQWLTMEDEIVRPSHQLLHKQVKPVDAPFKVGKYDMQYPGDDAGGPEEVIQCRCTIGGVERPEDTE